MDSITHIAIGACIGEVFAGKQLGKKAMVWGALAQSIPDIDFVASFWMETPAGLLAHRGFTHSILCCVLLTPVLTWMAVKWHRPPTIKRINWIFFFGSSTLIHILIDGFNNYGVGWFEPFSHTRITFNSIYVVDPFFSLVPGIAFAALILLKRGSPARRKWGTLGLGLASLYLLCCLGNKYTMDKDVKAILKKQQVPYSRYFTTPAPFQNWLWYVVAGDDHGYYVGYRSLFDRQKKIDFRYFPRNDSLLGPVRNTTECKQLIRFSQQFYTVDKAGEALRFNDLRFGQIAGWYDPQEDFAFHYYLGDPARNRLVVQRGRFSRWNRKVVDAFFSRIRGN